MIGMERMLIETLAFNLSARYPLGMMVKLIKKFLTREEWSTDFYPVAWDMAFDIYKTFAPLKKTTGTVALALLELTSRLTGLSQDKILAINCEDHQVSRTQMLEVMSDLLDLYTQSHKHTRLGALFPLDKFIDIKITINKEIEDRGIDFNSWCQGCSFHAPPPPFPPASRGGIGNSEAITKRFIFDRDAAHEEQEISRPYLENDFEEYETEVEEEIHPEPDRHRDRRGPSEPKRPSGPSHGRHGGRRGGGFGPGGHGGHGRQGDGGWHGRRREGRRGGGNFR